MCLIHKWESYNTFGLYQSYNPDVFCSNCGIFALYRNGKYLIEPLPNKDNFMNEYNEVVDLTIYNDRMNKGMIDKMFFIDKIEPDILVDFGCANGQLIKHISSWLPETLFFGYDIDPLMIQQAVKQDIYNASFYNSWDVVRKRISELKEDNDYKVAVVLSSIIHEVYHYQHPSDVDAFWNKILTSDEFDYIIIRDMMPSRSVDRLSDVDDVAKVYNKFLYTKQLQDFESVWGSIENNRNLVHFLLKYKYVEPNWNREVKENYLPLYREDFLSMVPLNYNVIYHEHYVLPYIKSMVKTDLNIDLKDPTHLKIILSK